MRILVYTFALVLGLAAGVAAIAVHRYLPGMVLGVGTSLVVIWALRQWLPRAATAFAAGWLVPLVAAIAGRPEGDVVVASDAYGWVLIGSGFVVLVTGLAWRRPPAPRRGSEAPEAAT